MSFDPQLIASDPREHVFVRANAGSGKTTTLVNRVARLLLSGAPPDQILCLTFTKAAASEMQSRLFDQLGHWAVADDATLKEILRKLDEPASRLDQTRKLFARALETPGGLKIQTIHAFCERLLRRFPLEAGLSPGFELMQGREAGRIVSKATELLFTEDLVLGAEFCQSRDRLIRHFGREGFLRLLSGFVGRKAALTRALDHLKKEGASVIYDSLGIQEDDDEEALWQDFFRTGALVGFRAKINDLLQKKGEPNKFATRLELFFNAYDQRHDLNELIEKIEEVFYTGGKPRGTANLFKGLDEQSVAAFLDVFSALEGVQKNIHALNVAKDTLDALHVFGVFSGALKSYKESNQLVDFNDLIEATRRLFSTPDLAAYVRFRLDDGLSHVLVDEAQDTSGEQWDIVRALVDDFFVVDETDKRVRTMFAVGDEKQSIYGFQGANPERFGEEIQTLSALAEQVGQTPAQPSLLVSYRTLGSVLAYVDATFARRDLTYALCLNEEFSQDKLTHIAFRTEALGRVELWPVVETQKAEERALGDEDDAGEEGTSAKIRLAIQIASTIKAALDDGQTIIHKGQRRPMHAGDILILVRKRDELFEHLLRHLKSLGVETAGADRLNLEDHIGFEDLRALMRVGLNPHDCLSLAAVLRSPLVGASEDDLYGWARGRKGPLYQALCQDRQNNQHRYLNAVYDLSIIDWAINHVNSLSIFDFLSEALQRKDRFGASMRQRLITRLGLECHDVLNEALNLALSAEKQGLFSVARALELFDYHATEIKREHAQELKAVRLMTIHGAKGLEAPWVIVPMAPHHKGSSKENLIFGDEIIYALRSSARKGACDKLKEMWAREDKKEEQEGLRLLYVALTRARDRLSIFRFKGSKNAPEKILGEWPDLCEQAFEAFGETARIEEMAAYVPFARDISPTVAVKVLGDGLNHMKANVDLEKAHEALPDFFNHPICEHQEASLHVSVTQFSQDDGANDQAIASPLSRQGGLGRYRRGYLIHKLFELLADLNNVQKRPLAQAYLDRQEGLSEAQKREIIEAVFGVLESAEFSTVFDANGRSEVAISGTIGKDARGREIRVSGRIDRLVITHDTVIILDYKSNQPAPQNIDGAAIGYRRQLAAYGVILRKIYPTHQIKTALLWTDGPRLTELKQEKWEPLIAEALAKEKGL